GAIEIAVLARQWMWKFEHPGGQSEINDLHLPAGEDIVLTMTSEDVIHSLYVPALRLKQDVLPGRYTTLWFNADTPGTYALACAEFCGTDHSVMGGRLIVMTPEAYADWLQARDAGPSLAAQGEDLYRSFGCSGCHEPGGPIRAPDLRGLFGSPAPLADGRVVTADEQYIRDSILLPNLHIAAGYEPIMPTFDGLIAEDEMLRLVAYIKSLGTRGPGEAP
ncbi:MAG: cupredoxin domain-containing protein, partial [Alphaproteobacteria bacterium]